MRRVYFIDMEWEIRDAREGKSCGFRIGRSTLQVEAETEVGAVNRAIDFCRNLPSWELKSNNIDIEDYREGNTCRYHDSIQLSKIISISYSPLNRRS